MYASVGAVRRPSIRPTIYRIRVILKLKHAEQTLERAKEHKKTHTITIQQGGDDQEQTYKCERTYSMDIMMRTAALTCRWIALIYCNCRSICILQRIGAVGSPGSPKTYCIWRDGDLFHARRSPLKSLRACLGLTGIGVTHFG